MHDTLLLPVKPTWADQIISGAKPYEFRRVPPRHLAFGGQILIYATAESQNVVRSIVGECSFAGLLEGTLDQLVWLTESSFPKGSDLRPLLTDYFAGKTTCYALHLALPRRYANPIPLEDIRKAKPKFRTPQSFMYLDSPRDDDILDLIPKK